MSRKKFEFKKFGFKIALQKSPGRTVLTNERRSQLFCRWDKYHQDTFCSDKSLSIVEDCPRKVPESQDIVEFLWVTLLLGSYLKLLLAFPGLSSFE